MAISSVNETKALNNEAYARECLRSGKCSATQRNNIIAAGKEKWGWDDAKIASFESKDATKYEIDDDQKTVAKNNADVKIKDKTDHDGSTDGVKSAAGTGMAAVGTVAGAAGGVGAFVVAAGIEKINTLLNTNFSAAKASGFVAAAMGAIVLGISLALKAMDPNKEQAQACDDLAPLMQSSQSDLEDQQDILTEETDNMVDATDELIEASDEANENTETQQKIYEKLQQEYQTLAEKYQASKSGGEPLTDAEKARFQELGGILDPKGELFKGLQQIKADGDANVEAAKENLEAQQEVYDDAAIKMEEVQEITDFSAEFDEATIGNAEMVRVGAYAGAVGSLGVIAGGVKAVSLGWPNFAEIAAGAVAIGEGTTSGLVFKGIISDQTDYKHRAEAGVDNRVKTEEVNTATSEVYEEDLETYVDNIDMTDEIIINESTASETTFIQMTDTNETGDPNGNPPAGAPPATEPPTINPSADDEGGGNNPFANPDEKDEDKV